MRLIVVGMGVQGAKRKAAAGADVVATVDPVREGVDFASVEEVPLESYDAACVCVPDGAKRVVVGYLLENGKHVLVEKPLLIGDDAALRALAETAVARGVLCYTAYNHRFEPHFLRMRELLAAGALGRIYALRMFYGNGTAALVRASPWRDSGAGVLADLGSHLVDTVLFWLGDLPERFELWSANRFENRALDHISFGAQAGAKLPLIQLEATLVSWRNHFYADIFGEKGSAHITSLCKWGPSTFIHRHRVLPAGRPDEDSVTLVQEDPTWAAEYAWFREAATGTDPAAAGNLGNDLRIGRALSALAAEAAAGAEA